MAYKHSVFIVLAAVPALYGFGGVAFAEEHSSAKTWASPNVAGMPGYKEPPKVDEIHAPIPRSDQRYGGNQVQPSNAPDAKK